MICLFWQIYLSCCKKCICVHLKKNCMNLATHAGLLWAPPADAADTSWQLIPRSLGLSKSEEAPPSICAHSLWSPEDFPEHLLCVKICKRDGQKDGLRIEFHRRDGYLIGFISWTTQVWNHQHVLTLFCVSHFTLDQVNSANLVFMFWPLFVVL